VAPTASNPNPQRRALTPLTPADAVAAIILVQDSYLVQLRDSNPEIFFPGQWGCFGGALEIGETEERALARELREELCLELAETRFSYFSRFVIDFGFAKCGQVFRSFYEVRIEPSHLAVLQLREGAAMQTFAAASLLNGEVPLTPFDSFALWLHISRERLER
jgi:8-oxo-dGTP pyrophosphatase MutT (NUDIX family)